MRCFIIKKPEYNTSRIWMIDEYLIFYKMENPPFFFLESKVENFLIIQITMNNINYVLHLLQPQLQCYLSFINMLKILVLCCHRFNLQYAISLSHRRLFDNYCFSLSRSAHTHTHTLWDHFSLVSFLAGSIWSIVCVH